MTLIITKSGEALTYSTVNPPRFTELSAIEDLLTDEQITLQDMYTLLFMYDKQNFKEKEEILLIIDRYCQFMVDEGDTNKIYMLAFYIDAVIHLKNTTIDKNEKFFSYIRKDEVKLRNLGTITEMMDIFNKITEKIKQNVDLQTYNKKINEILKQDIQNTYFSSLKGFYLLVNENIEKSRFIFAQEKNEISEIGNRYIRNIKNNNHKKENFEKFCKNNVCAENIISFIDIFTDILQNISEDIKNISLTQMMKNINELKSIYKNVDTNILNYYIAKIYHIKKDYLNAKNYYCQSNLKNAIYNLMNITRHVIHDNSIYNEILNYIYLCNNKAYKITAHNKNDKYYQVYKTIEDEKWCGSALISYYNLLTTNLIDKVVIWNNIAFYFVECLKERETYFIEMFYDLLKKNYVYESNFDTTLLKQQDISNKKLYEIVMFCKYVIVKNLKNTNDTISKYNLSFFLQDKESIELLQQIHKTHAEGLIHLAFLQNNVSMLNTLQNHNKDYFSFYTNYFAFKNARECNFTKYNKKTLNDFADVLQLANQIEELQSNNSNITQVKKLCFDKINENKKCVYYAFYYAYITYLEKSYNLAIKISNSLLDTLKTNKKDDVKIVCDSLYKIIGLSYINIGQSKVGLDYLNKIGNIENKKE